MSSAKFRRTLRNTAGTLLEVGFDDTAPNLPCTISSWALDAAIKKQVEVIDNRAVSVPCYSPAYTFVEKLQTVSTKFRQHILPSVLFSRQKRRKLLQLHPNCLMASY